jgi:hypothetical protein
MAGELLFPVLLRRSDISLQRAFDHWSLTPSRQRLGEEHLVALLRESLSLPTKRCD